MHLAKVGQRTRRPTHRGRSVSDDVAMPVVHAEIVRPGRRASSPFVAGALDRVLAVDQPSPRGPVRRRKNPEPVRKISSPPRKASPRERSLRNCQKLRRIALHRPIADRHGLKT